MNRNSVPHISVIFPVHQYTENWHFNGRGSKYSPSLQFPEHKFANKPNRFWLEPSLL